MRLKISEILEATDGKLLSGSEDTVVSSFSTDSRDIKSTTMFVPIKGENTDAHIYIEDVFESGACASFTEQEIPPHGDKAVVLVKNTRVALQKVAAYYRGLFDIPVIGVTGSAGKTTTKEMIALVLSSKFKVLKTAGNQNSQVGVPLTVCRLRKEHQAAVVEMGISMPGEMGRIASVVKPDYAVISNIGISHIEHLKTQENIMQEKLHIADYIKGDGILFVNGDDELLSTLKGSYQGKIATYGVGRGNDVVSEELNPTAKGTFFKCRIGAESASVFVPAPGIHNVRNALAAIAVAKTLGVSLEDATRAIAAYKPPSMRQEMFEIGGITVIDDSYNASPDSVHAAIDILTAEKTEGRKIAALADMLELGDYSQIGHLGVGKYAASKAVDLLIGVGPLSRDICKGYGEENALWFEDCEKAGEYLLSELKKGDTVLIKGSRGMKMDYIVSLLKENIK